MTQAPTVFLPTVNEVKTDEIPVTGATLKTTAVFLGKFCDELSKEFMLCKREERDPRKCLKEGKELTACGLEFYQKLKRTCRPEIEAYAQCIDKTSSAYLLNHCKKNKEYFDDCMKNKFGLERPSYGYFSQVRVHDSKRPKPKPETWNYEVLPGLPENYEEPAVPAMKSTTSQ